MKDDILKQRQLQFQRLKESDIIIAINKDASAPIFSVAHYGIVGDVNTILPKLIEKIKAYKE